MSSEVCHQMPCMMSWRECCSTKQKSCSSTALMNNVMSPWLNSITALCPSTLVIIMIPTSPLPYQGKHWLPTTTLWSKEVWFYIIRELQSSGFIHNFDCFVEIRLWVLKRLELSCNLSCISICSRCSIFLKESLFLSLSYKQTFFLKKLHLLHTQERLQPTNTPLGPSLGYVIPHNLYWIGIIRREILCETNANFVSSHPGPDDG